MIVAESVLDNNHWRAFGYRRTPRRGAFFDKFVSPEKLEREITLQRELWAAAFGLVFYWAELHPEFQYRIKFLARLMDLCVDGLDEPLWPVFRFRTRHEACEFLLEACRQYGTSDLGDHARVFLDRCRLRLNQEIPPGWIFGSAWLFCESIVQSVILALNEGGLAESGTSDIDVINQESVSAFEELFAGVP